jgi:hypothetical protein
VNKDRTVPLALFITGLGFMIYSAKYNIGSLTNPGVGFFPILIAGGLAGLAGSFLWQNSRQLAAHPEWKTREGMTQESIWVGKAYAVIATLLAFAALHAVLGYWVSVFGAMAALLRIAGVRSWKRAVLGGGITAVMSYLVFEYCLGAVFPEGYLR